MPVQHSPPAIQKVSQARAQAVLTATPRGPLDSTPEVPQLRAQFRRRSTIQEGRKREMKIKFFFSSCTGGPTLAHSNQPVSHHSEPSLLSINKQMTQIMTNLQAASLFEATRPPAFKTPSMKAPECFVETQPFRVRFFTQSCQLIFHNDLKNFSKDRNKSLEATSFHIDFI
ncbi:hypothetical protein O181_036540 [Austropuccinia psidii MF-1]|uniref:Uncharacterized protein n=1 Tax=Austropuccinia psidii MF-1 TaxID=1389203 RepID=A0A9Q3HCA1_9BASI|nr:hypothetical protein [Austropuccinia psidii MF-1]